MPDQPDIKPGALRPGPGIDPDQPWYQTPEGPVQGLSPESKAAVKGEWKGADLDASDLTDDADLPKALDD